jgi:regulator of protease activity HflC (stomatin/prohibitin superfamily)
VVTVEAGHAGPFAVVTYKVADPVKAVGAVEDYRQALYREARLALLRP